jgi:hypothetical protein
MGVRGRQRCRGTAGRRPGPGSRGAATRVRNDWQARPQTVKDHDCRLCHRWPLTWRFSRVSLILNTTQFLWRRPSADLARRKPGVQIPSPPPPTLQVRASPASSGRRSLHVAAALRPQAKVKVQSGRLPATRRLDPGPHTMTTERSRRLQPQPSTGTRLGVPARDRSAWWPRRVRMPAVPSSPCPLRVLGQRPASSVRCERPVSTRACPRDRCPVSGGQRRRRPGLGRRRGRWLAGARSTAWPTRIGRMRAEDRLSVGSQGRASAKCRSVWFTGL